MCEPSSIVIGWQISWLCLNFSGPKWHNSKDGAVLLASRRYDGSRSRKTRGSLADTLQCNIWRRAQTPHRITHCLHGGDNHGKHNGFTALGKSIGTSKSTESDANYVTEHRALKYLRPKIAYYLHDYRRHWRTVTVPWLIASTTMRRAGLSMYNEPHSHFV